MRKLGGGGGGSRSFGGSGGGSRSFGGFHGDGSSSTRRVSSGGSNSSFGSGVKDSISTVGSILGALGLVVDILSYVIYFLVRIFGVVGATVAGGVILSAIMFAVSVKAGLFTMLIYTVIVLSVILISKKVKRSQIDMSFMDDFACDTRYDRDIIYSREFEAYMLEKLRSSGIIDKKNRIKEGHRYELYGSFERIYKEYMKENDEAEAAAEESDN